MTGFKHPEATDRLSWLRYRHLLRGQADGKFKPGLITDFMGYNSAGPPPNQPGNLIPGAQPGNWATDLILECEATIDQVQGQLVLELARGSDRFQAQFNLADGNCTLLRLTAEKGKPRTEKLARVKTTVRKGTYRLRFSDVDEQLLLWVNDKLVFSNGVKFSAPSVLIPSKENDLEPASVGVQGTQAHVRHLKLWRDTYYTTRLPGPIFKPDDPSTWDGFKEMPIQTYFVRPGHYFCLGDNSPHSADSRNWGLVPARLLLGRAVLLYFPAERAGWIR